jgi:hypothetical protein
LLKELYKKEICPFLTYFPRLARVRNVSQVEQSLENHIFVALNCKVKLGAGYSSFELS